MVIAHNISAINTYNKMGISSSATDKSMEKLSSGYKINRAADDAAGLSISEKMRSQIRGLNQASENAENGISMIQTAEGALNEAHSILQRMRELAVQAANDTNAASDRQALQSEINQLTSEINRIGNTTEFNGMKILNGSKVAITGKEKIEVAAKDGGTIATFPQAIGASNGANLKLTTDVTVVADPTGKVNYDNLQAKEGANVITISKENGALKATINLVEADATTVTNPGYTKVDTASMNIIYNANTKAYDFSYNGITFSVDEKSVQDYITNGEDSDVTTIDLYKACEPATGQPVKAITKGTFSIDNVYEEDSSSKGKITNLTLSTWASNTRIDYDRLEIEFTGGTDKSDLVVKFYNGSDCVNTDTIASDDLKLEASPVTTAKDYTYNAYGTSFKITAGEGFKTGDKIHLNVNLEDYFETTTVDGTGQAKDNSVYFHVGANTNQVINTTFGDMRAHALGLTGNGEAFATEYTVNNGTQSENTEKGLNISTREGANRSIDIIDNAITMVSQERSKYGAIQNRLEYTINNLDTTSENMTSAESTVRDVDMASEMMEMTKNQILQQASQAMLSQAMQRPQQVLQLLQ